MNISINLYLMLVVFVTFIVLMWLLHLWVYQPLLANMDGREGSMQKDRQFIDNTTKEIVASKQEAKNLLREARLQADKILQDALQQARSNYEVVLAQKEEELNKDYKRFATQLKESKSNLKLQLLQDLPALEASLKLKISQM
ncbi:HrpE/YscL family type III secretion apparatus protein [Helicobacter mehlei]|uniref:F0F1 ATP synthase subunit B n=1 Tax=Helicobacter mehlei TaxID=2316080 RepID=A0A553V3F8_9HELI|nr:HrpE/YscL family type III secretion apparatus protein [Helicobacter mehlei]TSA86980.1 F0F1 ATP synthase subunit B' [Helicobacter mehlei]